MSLPSSSWWLPVLSLVSLGGQGCGTMGGGGAERGLRDSFSRCSPSLSHSHHPGFELSPVHQGRGDSGSSPQGCGGACVPFSGVLQLHVCDDQGVGRVEAHYRSLHSQPLGGDLEVSYRDGPISSSLGAERRLDGLHRSERRLPSGSDSSSESKVFEVHGRRESLAVQGSLLRSVHGTSGLHPGYGSSVRLSSSAGRPDVEISGRLADNGILSGGSLLGKGQGSPTLSRVGYCGKSRQILFDSISSDCISGNQDRVADFPGFADSFEDRKVLLNSRRISVLKGTVCEVLEGSARASRVVDAPSPRWPTPDEGSAVSSQKGLKLRRQLGLGSLGCSFSRRSSVVVRRGSSRGGSVSGCSTSGPHVLVRRLRSGVRGNGGRPVCVRPLVRG